MIKNLLLTASTGFIAILLIANSAIAISFNNSLAQTRHSTLDLNTISPSLQLVSNTPANHFGCSCSTCIQSARTTTTI